MNGNQCSALVPGQNICRNGFPQNSACYGFTCPACGKHTNTVPACLREDLGPAWIDDTGRPKFSKL